MHSVNGLREPWRVDAIQLGFQRRSETNLLLWIEEPRRFLAPKLAGVLEDPEQGSLSLRDDDEVMWDLSEEKGRNG